MGTKRSKSEEGTRTAFETLCWVAAHHFAATGELHTFAPRVFLPRLKEYDVADPDDPKIIEEYKWRGLWNRKILMTRSSYIMVALNQHLNEARKRNQSTLQDPTTASPTRPPRITIYVKRISADPHTRVYAWSFAEFYAARRAVDCLIQDYETSWVDDNSLKIFGPRDIKAIVYTSHKPDGLNDLMEYEFQRHERDYQVPHDLMNAMAAIFALPKPNPEVKDAYLEQPAPKQPKEPKQPKPAKAPKPAGLVDLPTLLADTDITPKEARTALRAMKAEKPEHGRWEWPASTANELKPKIIAAVKKARK